MSEKHINQNIKTTNMQNYYNNTNSTTITHNTMNKTQQNNNNTQNNNKTTYANKLKNKNITVTPPKRNQAIVMDSYPEINITEYLLSFGKIISPQKITYASRISDKRVCIYFTDTDSVDQIIKEHNSIPVADKNIEIRRLINPTIKIIISNVYPELPNEIIENKLTQLGLKLASSISYLKIGTRLEEFNHIISFRRQVYLIKTENYNLPNYVNVEHEGYEYRIFLMEDNLRCNNCKKHGHTESQCHHTRDQPQEQKQSEEQSQQSLSQQLPLQQPLTQQSPSQQLQTQQSPLQQSQQYETTPLQLDTIINLDETHTDSIISTQEINQIKETYLTSKEQQWDSNNESQPETTNKIIHNVQVHTDLINCQNKKNAKKLEQTQKMQTTQPEKCQNTSDNSRQKRSLPHSSNDSINQDNNNSSNTTNTTIPQSEQTLTRQTKKTKTNRSRSVSPKNLSLTEEQTEEILKKLKPKFQKNNYKLNFEIFKKIIENVQNNADPLTTVKDYTEDIEEFLKILQDLYQHAPTPSLKQKFTKLITKIKKQLEEEEETN